MGQFLIIGLGNPGNEYASTRHNAGFMAADMLGAHFDAKFVPWARAKADYFKTEFNGHTFYALKPMEYMNLSGRSAAAFANFYKIPPQNILVIFDDMSLPLGAVRMRAGGSAGGHNGMAHIIEQFGAQDIARLRIGIGPRPAFFEGRDFVLSKFNAAEKPLLKAALERAKTAALDFAQSGIDAAMNKANQN